MSRKKHQGLSDFNEGHNMMAGRLSHSVSLFHLVGPSREGHMVNLRQGLRLTELNKGDPQKPYLLTCSTLRISCSCPSAEFHSTPSEVMWSPWLHGSELFWHLENFKQVVIILWVVRECHGIICSQSGTNGEHLKLQIRCILCFRQSSVQNVTFTWNAMSHSKMNTTERLVIWQVLSTCWHANHGWNNSCTYWQLSYISYFSGTESM